MVLDESAVMDIFIGENRWLRRRMPEFEFQEIILQLSPRLFEGWTYAPWTQRIQHQLDPDRRADPDAVLVDLDAMEWFVVEVELASHPLSHIDQQLEVFRYGHYSEHMLPKLSEAIPTADQSDLRELLRSQPPATLCIVDKFDDEIARACRDLDCELLVAWPYRSDRGGPAALAIERFPRALERDRDVGVWPLGIRDVPMGERVGAVLPATFPNADSISVEIDGALHSCRVMSMHGARIAWLPAATYDRRGEPLRLRAIDLGNLSFRLDAG
jgi:hypothetical protein